MKSCEYAGEPLAEPRSHPWSDTAGSPDCRYYDLTATPERIRTSLEDFIPWGRYPAIEDFYALLGRINHARSPLESNDCAFAGPHANDTQTVDKTTQCSGRLMLLFRALERNVEAGQVEQLKDGLHQALSQSDTTFRWGMVGTSLIPARFLALPTPQGDAQLGLQLMISFWAWGDDEADSMINLRRLFRNLARAVREVCAHPGVATPHVASEGKG